MLLVVRCVGLASGSDHLILISDILVAEEITEHLLALLFSGRFGWRAAGNAGKEGKAVQAVNAMMIKPLEGTFGPSTDLETVTILGLLSKTSRMLEDGGVVVFLVLSAIINSLPFSIACQKSRDRLAHRQ